MIGTSQLINAFGAPVCFTDTTDIFKDRSGVALYGLDYDASDAGGASGKFGEAAIFNGTTSKIELPSALSDGVTTDATCISFWFNVGAEVTSSTTSNEIMQFAGTSSLTGKIALGSTSGHMSGETFSVTHNVSGVYTYSQTNIPAGWNHAVVQWNSSDGKWDIYINSVKHTTYTVGTNAQGKFKLKFGNRDSVYYTGSLDQIRIYNTALTQSQVTQLYQENSSTVGTHLFGCIANYNLDGSAKESMGTTAYDGTETDITYRYDGTPTDVDFGVGGKSNYGARFNGSSSKITLPTGSPFNDSDTIKAISAWVKAGTSTSRVYPLSISSTSNASDYWYIGYMGDLNAIYVATRNGSTSNQSIAYATITPDTNWHHLVVQITATEKEIYLDGVKQTITNSNSGTGTNTSWISYPSYDGTVQGVIGILRLSSPQYSDGSIDQVRIFNKAISAAEVSKLYGNGAGEIACTYTSTTDSSDIGGTNQAYYKFDNDVLDYSGNGNNGTSSSMVFSFGKFGQAAIGDDTTRNFVNPQPFNTGDTISFWTRRRTAVGGAHAIFGQHAGTYNFFSCRLHYGNDNTHKIQFYIRNSTSAYRYTQTSYTPDNGNWSHWVVAFNSVSSNPTVYLNGEEQSVSVSNSSGSMSSYAQSNAIIGRAYINGSTYNMNGYLDQMRTFTSARTVEQITELYNEKPEVDTSNFKTVLYEGTGATQYISNVGMDLETDGGLVWIKNRYSTQSHRLYDSVRGANLQISSNQTAAEGNSGGLTSFDSNGFSLDNWASVNTNGNTYVSWVFKGGGDAVSNTDGDITSQVSANTEAGFSIVKYIGNGLSSEQTVGHGMDYPPELVIIKDLDNVRDWYVYTDIIDGSMDVLYLNKTDAKVNSSRTSPTSNVYKIAGNTTLNKSNQNFISYCFHSVSGYSSIGTYSGTSSTGNAITGLGFQPNWLMVKRTDASGNSWLIVDNRRVESNGNLSELFANATTAETTGYDIDFTSDGFTLNTTTTNANASGTDNYIYMAFK